VTASCREAEPRLLEVDGDLVRCILHDTTALREPALAASEGTV
jgi:hypothetical protein